MLKQKQKGMPQLPGGEDMLVMRSLVHSERHLGAAFHKQLLLLHLQFGQQ